MATREQGLRQTGPITAGTAALATAGMIGFGVLAHEHSTVDTGASTTTSDTTSSSSDTSTDTTSSGSTTDSNGLLTGSTGDSGSTHATTGGS
ncbi:hypothetical protein MXD61_07440 [Frankia sp. AgPm24]|uniref:hypothetical protein n=1 Tax=Frankia sp. AgPm24 TaxID=631128 RepID=UPI00200FBBE4|nr:hypothetical protein [Frankia sp. AgPm24]MCK9921722.1 hypothetical protein [Frankia sp. AgPm24]